MIIRSLHSRVTFLIAAPLFVTGFADAAIAQSAGISARVETINDEVLRGRVLGCSSADGVIVRLREDEDRRVPIDHIVRIVTGVTEAVPEEGATLLALNNGDRVHGKITGANGDAIVISTADMDDIVVPLERIRSITHTSGRAPAHRATLDLFNRVGDPRDGAATEPDEDIILLTNGDIIRGFITAVDAEGVTIESRVGETTVLHRLILSLRLAAVPPEPLSPPYFRVTLQHSGRLTVGDLSWSGDIARVGLHDGRELAFEADRIVRVDVLGGKWEWLSSHRPISFQHTPMVSLGWGYRTNRNVLSRPITVAGETYEYGVGVHSRSSLTYDLKGAYQEFVTYFGIDDESGPLADVSVLVLVDGRRRFEQDGVRRGTLHGPVRIDVKRAKRIELIVEFGANGELQDRFNWVESALVR